MSVLAEVSRRLRTAWSATTVVMLVLVGSVAVATMLASQAMTAAQQRQAVTDSMLREYGRLAAWEFSREASKDIEMSAMRTIAARAHPDRHVSEGECDCEPITAVDEWFEYLPGTGVFSDSPTLTSAMKEQIAREAAVTYAGVPESVVRLWQVPDDPQGRIVAMRWEPHLGSGGGQMGFVFAPEALGSVLGRAHRRATLLPSMTTGDREAARFVDVKVHDRSGRTVFASPGTEPGPHGFEANLLSNSNLDLRVSTSMTPAFVSTLGPEHGAGPGRNLVMGLVAVNALLVAIGIWQLARERELARLRANFVAGVSHELRTPLAQIRMFAETLMLDRIRNPDEGKRAVDIIGRETRRLGQLVENVLYFHRHDRLPALEATELVDLVPLVRDVVDGFAPLAAARRVQITFAPAVEQLTVRANPDGLRQVLLNLLDNAVKFGPAGQTVPVTLEAVGNGARMIVEDQGPGIPVSERRRIFNAFERGRETRGAGGAGIGLAVVQQIVNAHGGTVSVESAPNAGSRFVVTLPGSTGRLGSHGRRA